MRLLRPNETGSVSMSEFVKRVDEVYRELRLLDANIMNDLSLDESLDSVTSCVLIAVTIVSLLIMFGARTLPVALLCASVLISLTVVAAPVVR